MSLVLTQYKWFATAIVHSMKSKREALMDDSFVKFSDITSL
jgi:hypothetical protein